MTKMYCIRCGTIGFPAQKAPGSAAFGCVLLLFFIIPGLLYFAWQLFSQCSVCPACGSQELVPADSPRARSLQGAAPPAARAELASSRQHGNAACPGCGAEPPTESYIGGAVNCPGCGSSYVRDVERNTDYRPAPAEQGWWVSALLFGVAIYAAAAAFAAWVS